MLITRNTDFLPRAMGHIQAVRARKGISFAPVWPQAIDIAGTSLHAEGNGKEAQDDTLPPLISAAHVQRRLIRIPPLLVHDLLHRGTKMVLAGSAKTNKTWSLMDLGLSVAAGVPWWGFKCEQGNVVYLNFELGQPFFEERMFAICDAKGIAAPPRFISWHLRAKCYDLRRITRYLRARLEMLNFQVDMLIVDPLYKAYGGLDENSATQMAMLMETVERLSEETQACIVFGAHFSKGNQAGREFQDRISGSGVFGRDPDVIMTMTKHMSPGSYSVESVLRYLRPLPDFVVTWKWPLLYVDEGKDPRQLFTPAKAVKEDGMLTEEEILSVLTIQGMNVDAWSAQVRAKFGKAGPSFYEAKKRLLDKGKVKRQGFKYLPVDFALASQ